MTSLADTRREYIHDSLSKKQLNNNPFEQLKLWLEQAKLAELKDATAMTLSTAGKDAMPDARIVLLKDLNNRGLSWYTNYASQKGQQLEENAQACLLFYWREFDRQVKVQGMVEQLPAGEADSYFHSRPLDSQFSAAASQQSKPIESRKALQQKVDNLKKINPEHVERPDNWGGYQLIPTGFEFWQGRENRLHDRFTYTCDSSENSPTQIWKIQRLQP